MRKNETLFCPLIESECKKDSCIFYLELTLKSQCAIRHIAEFLDNLDSNIQTVKDDCYDD